jgi:hypothetical protein
MAKVTAYGKLGDHDIEAEVIDPGNWFGKCWLIEVGCGYSSIYYVVEADNVTDALDEFVGSEPGKKHAIIDPSDYGDYGTEVNPGDMIGGKTFTEKGRVDLNGKFYPDGDKDGKYLQEPYYGSGGELADLDNIQIHGMEGADLPWPCEYAVEGHELIAPKDYGQPTYNVVRRQSLKEEGELIRAGFKDDSDANNWVREEIKAGRLEGEEWEYDNVEVPCPYPT